MFLCGGGGLLEGCLSCEEKFGKPMLSFYKDQIGLFEAAEGTKLAVR